MPLRAAGDRVLLIRVHDRSELLVHVHEVMGVTDRVKQFGEVVGMGNGETCERLRRDGLEVGDLVVYDSPRIDDHFSHTFTEGRLRGTKKVIVYPAKWVHAIVKGTFIAENPEAREYGAPLE